MSRKSTFLIILIVVSLCIGGLAGFYFYNKNKNQAPTILGQSTSGKSFGGYTPKNQNSSSNLDDTPDLTVKGSEKKDEPVKKLRRISAEPVAGAGFVTIPLYASSSKNIEPEDLSRTNGKVVKPSLNLKIVGYLDTIRFMERATGHIFETSSSTLENARISNTTLPKIYEAYFTKNGNNVLIRDLVGNTDTIRTRYGVLALATTTDTEKSLVTTTLTSGISQVALSPEQDKFVSIVDEGVSAFISKLDGSNKQSILELPFSEWLASWPEKKSIILTTKPTGFYPGYAYEINPETKAFSRVLGDIYGLTTLASPDATKILFSRSSSGGFRMYLLNRKTDLIRDLNVRTFPEKCTWATTEKDVIYCAVPEDIAFNTYPDVWYQGKISFSDSIWKLNTLTGETRLLSKLQEESGGIIDVQSISIDSKDDYLIFTDKNTLTLWGLMLKEPVKAGINPLDVANSTTTASTTISATTTKKK